eukprot:CAMPEP_0118922578 /NCGR_PEP_ID=MMETSP1169-20130426/1461_1 /TAXON_ID=36882 /ORGANISM="Pyramimonas obovata, Strain CCMP722" /LENGTH=103 /DNA_ID=CAMNT_0006863475 /DNA_START=83 /DNA_END=394 /DNA_ORIENTATION=+
MSAEGFKKSMMGMFETAKKGAAQASEATTVAAKKAKLMSEIKWLESKLKSRKEKFGVDVYDSLINNEHGEVDRILSLCKAELEELKQEIMEKQGQLDLLRANA